MGSKAWDDAELLARCREDDREAFGFLAERHAPRLYSVALRLLGETAAAEDAVQETLLAAFTALPSFRGEARVSTWLHRIAVNKCHDWLRARGRFEDGDPGEDEDGETPGTGSDHQTPEQVLSQKQLAGHLDEAIDGLAPLYREAFLLRHVEGMEYDEMVEVLGVSRDTLKMRVYKARTELARRLEEWLAR